MTRLRNLLTPVGDVTSKAVRALLEPLEAVCPQAITASLQALDAGHTPSEVGTVLAAGLQAWGEQIRQTYAQERAGLEKEITHCRQELDQSVKQLGEAKRQVDQLRQQLEACGQENARLRQTLADQNRLIARQHLRLQDLFCEPPGSQNGEDT